MSFNHASFVLASSGPYRLWLYSTEDNLASNTAGALSTDYFKNANAATLAGGSQNVRRGDIILAANAATQSVTVFGVTYGNVCSVTAQASAASAIG